MASAWGTAATSPETADSLPLTVEHRASPAGIVAAGAFIFVAAAVLLTPFSLLLARAAVDPDTLLAMLRRPVVAVQLTTGLAIAVAFVAIPLRLLLRRALQPRRIVIAGDAVHASSGSDESMPTWSEPLSAYRGVAHHIRTSLSGAHHEIVLVHPEASKSVVLHSAPRIAQPQVDAMAALLKVGEVPAGARFGRERTTPRPQLPVPALEAA